MEIDHPGLRYISPEKLTIRRQSQGKSFRYIDEKTGEVIKEPRVLQRIKDLVIPPAWKDVHISPSPTGHIQVIGVDDRKRKQYMYHPLWTQLQQQHKFDKMIFFGEVLPEIRSKINSDMRLPGLPREKVVATVVWLLQKTFIRIGNQVYADDNQSYGLTTLRQKHVDVEGSDVTFEFKGKSGVFHSVDVRHPQVAKTIRKCIELPGYELFKYVDDEGERHVVDSQDVNEYLKALAGEEVSAKEFRTWGGTVFAATTLYETGPAETEADLKKNLIDAVKSTAGHLRNTPAVCRAYYIHPTVVESYTNSILVPHFKRALQAPAERNLHREEHATWTLLKKYSQA